MSENTTRGVTRADLEENFALRDEIKQLRILIAAIVRGSGGRFYLDKKHFKNIKASDTVTQEADNVNDRIILTFEGKP